MSNSKEEIKKAITDVANDTPAKNNEVISNKTTAKRKRVDESHQSTGSGDNSKQPKIDNDLLFFYPRRYTVVDGKEILIRDPNYTFVKQYIEMGDWLSVDI
ncbi:hypothetical protein [Parasitella parasitica]|uniref:Uncharacterized protein n=1 Tax=Parasitella parasitica TaxID=35722 RepID=A0A0B7MWQ0_9FUNG|nr:hypothetical protein [Parasitella parasitica]